MFSGHFEVAQEFEHHVFFFVAAVGEGGQLSVDDGAGHVFSDFVDGERWAEVRFCQVQLRQDWEQVGHVGVGVLEAAVVGVGGVAFENGFEDWASEEFVHFGAQQAAVVVGPAPAVWGGLGIVACFFVENAGDFEDGAQDGVAESLGEVGICEDEQDEVFHAVYGCGEGDGSSLAAVEGGAMPRAVRRFFSLSQFGGRMQSRMFRVSTRSSRALSSSSVWADCWIHQD